MQSTWTVPAEFPELQDSDVHVWRIQLTADDPTTLRALLSEDEIRRADRFLFERHREHFVVGRARMRQLLSRYIDVEACEINFVYDNLGKPRFDHNVICGDIRFNFSNSNDRGLLAIAGRTEVGVDLERIRPMNDMLGLARRYYSENESGKLFQLTPTKRPAAFFRCWTRKEAYLKAIGKGLTFPLRKVEVTLLPDEECSVLHIDDAGDDAAAWGLFHLDPADEYVGAVAVRRNLVRVQQFDYRCPPD